MTQIGAVIVADSISLADVRITTFELQGVPKWLIGEWNTYRMEMARNSASSRAIPSLRIVEQLERDPFVFSQWRYRAPEGGMTPGGPMTPEDAEKATRIWLWMRDQVTDGMRELEEMKTAKEQMNRAGEPWMKTSIVATVTGLDNLYTQRLAGDAQGEFQQLARAMQAAQGQSRPTLRYGKLDDQRAWHLPYVTDAERWQYAPYLLAQFSADRCKRVSYLRQGLVKSPEEEMTGCDQLIASRHWSPLEMPCFVLPTAAFCGPFRGWMQFRKFFGGESGTRHHGTQIDHPWVASHRLTA